MIYLDNAATTYPKPEEVYIALDKANRNAFNTGRGSYKCAREASETKEAVRNKILNINKIKKIFLFSCRIVPDHSNQVPQHFYYLPQNRSCPEHFISALKIHHQNSIQFRFPPGYAPG